MNECLESHINNIIIFSVGVYYKTLNVIPGMLSVGLDSYLKFKFMTNYTKQFQVIVLNRDRDNYLNQQAKF